MAQAILDDQHRLDRECKATAAELVTLQLGEPPLGALQLRFAPGRAPDEAALAQLASFAVRAAHALRSSERAREAGLELERSRALLAVVGEAIARLSLAHTLDTALERLGGHARHRPHRRLPHATDGRSPSRRARRRGAARSGRGGLLATALASRQRGRGRGRRRLDRRAARAGSGAGEERGSLGWRSALVVGDEPIGLLAVYPRRPRPLSANERALLVALAAQLAVAVQNARLHERGDRARPGARGRRSALSGRRRSGSTPSQDLASFAQSLSLETTLDVLAESIVTLLGVDAAVIRMPDERGIELTARAVYVNDERVDAAARALLSRPQQLPRRELLALLGAKRATAPRRRPGGGARWRTRSAGAVFAQGLERGIVPIATPAELLATLTIVSLHPGRPVAGEIADTALSIAGQAALAIDNARLYAQQKAFADTMQRSLLPRAAPEIPGLELGDVYESAARLEVGGDVYDYLTLGDGRLAVVLGDVTGHGVDATADMAMAKYVFRSLAREHSCPATSWRLRTRSSPPRSPRDASSRWSSS